MIDVTSLDDVIDSRDVASAAEDMLLDELRTDEDGGDERAIVTFDAEGRDAFGSAWDEGVELVRDSYFVDYAEELAEDIGAVMGGGRWPTNCIDWEWAARELQMDYTAVEFDGVTYWGRE